MLARFKRCDRNFRVYIVRGAYADRIHAVIGKELPVIFIGSTAMQHLLLLCTRVHPVAESDQSDIFDLTIFCAVACETYTAPSDDSDINHYDSPLYPLVVDEFHHSGAFLWTIRPTPHHFVLPSAHVHHSKSDAFHVPGGNKTACRR